ncbi:MAG: riboflavin synthase [Coriobacteriia bacterium]|nr:riboflavin synthase [Coriobacteriia bacterium]
MFTGIVEEVGKVSSIRKGAHSAVLTVSASKVLEGVHLGDSIATNGVCLTVTSFDAQSFSADVMHETLNRSSLGALHGGSLVNLERAMAADGRFGGHIVSGHIDGTGCIRNLRVDDNAVWYTIEASADIMRYVVEKGSITIDGISLTVAKVTEDSFSVSVIPHTRAVTNLATKGVGDVVNLETDIIGKYVERLLAGGSCQSEAASASTAGGASKPSDITEEFLAKHGF